MLRVATAASLVLALLLALLLLATSSPRGAQAGKPPVVVVVFDALPVLMLMDEGRQIDAVRYPNFAALARASTWYRNATMVHDSTVKSVPAILDGDYPRRPRRATFREHPHNLFTLLGGRYRIEAFEQATRLCPRRLCRRRVPGRVISALHGPRLGRFRRAVASIRPSRRPTLTFMHVLLPHEPLQYLPSGKEYQYGRDPEPELDGPGSYTNPWLTRQAQQRHVLQLGFVDRLLGQLLDRLRQTGLYDRAVIVVTADHGMSFVTRRTPAPPFIRGKLGFRRDLTEKNAGELAAVPLFIKAP